MNEAAFSRFNSSSLFNAKFRLGKHKFTRNLWREPHHPQAPSGWIQTEPVFFHVREHKQVLRNFVGEHFAFFARNWVSELQLWRKQKHPQSQSVFQGASQKQHQFFFDPDRRCRRSQNQHPEDGHFGQTETEVLTLPNR